MIVSRFVSCHLFYFCLCPLLSYFYIFCLLNGIPLLFFNLVLFLPLLECRQINLVSSLNLQVSPSHAPTVHVYEDLSTGKSDNPPDTVENLCSVFFITLQYQSTCQSLSEFSEAHENPYIFVTQNTRLSPVDNTEAAIINVHKEFVWMFPI